MLDLDERHPLADFQTKASEYLEQLRSDGKPHVLTVDGKPAVVVQDAEAYEKLLAELDKAEAIAGIRRGLDAVKKGEFQEASVAREEMSKELGISKDKS